MMDFHEIQKLPYRPCVGLMVVNGDGLIFAGQRIDRPGAWQMPQGGIDKGESEEAAALRELQEETSISPESVEITAKSADWLRYDLPTDLVPKIWKGRFRGQKQRWFLMRFSGSDRDIDLATKHPEFDKWNWMGPDALLEQIVDFKKETYAQVIEEFEGLI